MVIFRPNPRRGTAPTVAPEDDRVPPWLASGTPPALSRDLGQLLGSTDVSTRAIDLVRYATDASPYRLIPHVVVRPRTAAQVSALFRWARQSGHHLNFRAAGTSLNGQAQGGDVLVDVRHHFVGLRIEANGERVRVRPGMILDRVNQALARYGRRLGPDPASSHTSTVGGAIANNASGYAAGVTDTAYRTLRSATIVLPTGTIVDTGAPDADELLAATEPELTDGLLAIGQAIRDDRALADRIRSRHALQNTNGYRLDAFLDQSSPAAILTRLIVGSEGTLGFVAEAVLDTVPLRSDRACALLVYPNVSDAVARVPEFAHAGAPVVELMDAGTLHGAAQQPDGDPSWASLPPESAALLVELRAEGADQLAGQRSAAELVIANSTLLGSGAFTSDPDTMARYWRVREGMLALAGVRRPPESTLLIEDVCVPPDRVAEAVADLRTLQSEHGFTPSVQGHALTGNLHFWLTPRLNDPEERRRYDGFVQELVRLVLDRYDGSLRAEHGTGRTMAPFLVDEWGERAVGLMWRLRRLLDPAGVLAPDVMLSRDPELHLKHLQSMPTVEDAVDSCIECGYCEPVCPSRSLTTTPRQRIAIRREIARQPAGSRLARTLLDQYEYDGIQTCAADGSCAMACPLGIDTGALVEQFRHAERSGRAEWVALRVAKHWRLAQRVARAAIRTGHRLGTPLTVRLTGALRRVVSPELMPAWLSETPYAAPSELPSTPHDGAAAVYFPACVNRILGHSSAAGHGPSGGGAELPEAMVAVSERAGLPIRIPERVEDLCCGTVWHAKGYRDGNSYMANKVVERLWRASERGRLPIVVDASACTLGLVRQVVPYLTPENRRRHAELTVYDSVNWVAERLLPNLTLTHRLGRAVVQPTCSARRLGVRQALVDVVSDLAEHVQVPDAAGCCGFAGDRGFLHPQLPRSATAEQAAELGAGPDADAYLCSDRTCEVGMRHGTGRAYESFVLTLERLSRGSRPERSWLPRQRTRSTAATRPEQPARRSQAPNR